MGLKGYQMGKTKVFLRAGQMAELDARRAEVLGNAAKIIQRQTRTYIARREFIAMRKAAIKLQTRWRGKLARILFEQMRREAAAVNIQKNFRRYVSRTSYLSTKSSAVTLQTGLRAMVSHKEFRFRKQTKAAICIQAHFRCHREYSYYQHLQKAALITQCGWRRRVARRELRKLKMAARETGALKEAKDKLEKRVEELSWRLQFEKRLRKQLEEANANIVKEREAARKAIEEAPPVIKETPVMVEDTEKINMLTAEVESLKAQLEKERQTMEDERKARADAEVRNSELAKKLEDSDRKLDQLQDSVQRLEEKLSNTESENQVLRQQALTMSPTGKPISGRPKAVFLQSPKTPENGNVINGETKVAPDTILATPIPREPESEEKPQKSLNEKQQENQELLIKCVSQNLGFSGGKPVAASVIYKSLLHWRSFEVERTSIFDRIIQTIAVAIE
ncbi:hypothetical protein CRG98_033808, partial [Punica granatum]